MEKRKNAIVNIVYWVLILAAVYLTFRHAIWYIMPFLIGFLIALILKPLIDRMERKLRLNRRLAAVICVAFFYVVIGSLLTLLIVMVINYIVGFFGNLEQLYATQIQPYVQQLLDVVDFDWERFDPELARLLQAAYDSISTSLLNGLSSLSGSVLDWGTRTLGNVPGFLVNMLFTIISTFFIASDYGNITRFILRQLPERSASLVVQVKRHLGEVIGQFIRSYSLILCITFVELLIGLAIMRVDNFVIIALIIAVFDILPVVGTGAIVIPWGIIKLIQGDIWMGVGLLLMYVIITVIRNIIEPKIVGDNVGLHPLVTLMSMYLGTKIFGGIGLFGLPISLAILVALNEKGAIQLFKRPPKADPPATGDASPDGEPPKEPGPVKKMIGKFKG